MHGPAQLQNKRRQPRSNDSRIVACGRDSCSHDRETNQVLEVQLVGPYCASRVTASSNWTGLRPYFAILNHETTPERMFVVPGQYGFLNHRTCLRPPVPTVTNVEGRLTELRAVTIEKRGGEHSYPFGAPPDFELFSSGCAPKVDPLPPPTMNPETTRSATSGCEQLQQIRHSNINGNGIQDCRSVVSRPEVSGI
jgi:hypothetical protein